MWLTSTPSWQWCRCAQSLGKSRVTGEASGATLFDALSLAALHITLPACPSLRTGGYGRHCAELSMNAVTQRLCYLVWSGSPSVNAVRMWETCAVEGIPFEYSTQRQYVSVQLCRCSRLLVAPHRDDSYNPLALLALADCSYVCHFYVLFLCGEAVGKLFC